MCGIAGFLDSRDGESKERLLRSMTDSIIHRGPDSEGHYIDGEAAIGFRRLSIVDRRGGDQPIYNEDRSLLITFNGEIYNYRALRAELIERGHNFVTESDTETILHGYEEYGSDIVSKLRGMFAFVIWDSARHELFGARDPFGIKPFYYYNDGAALVYGSEIKSILLHPEVKKSVNSEALSAYLTFQFSALNETFFAGIHKLRPGYYFRYNAENGFRDTQYYEASFSRRNLSYEDYMEEIKSTLAESVEAHKIGEVKVGSYLSGGVDSSYIAAELMPEHTFSVGFDAGLADYNETDQAKRLSELLGIENVRHIITPEEFFGCLDDVVYHSDEPHGNMSAVPLYLLSQMATKYVTVVLSGEGADELFGGYETYAVSASDRRFRSFVPRALRHYLGAAAAARPRFHGRRFLTRNGLMPYEYYSGSAFIFDEAEKHAVLRPEMRSERTYLDIARPVYENVKDEDPLTQMQYFDMKFWLPEDILLKADKMTMAHSLELRVPFLDREVMECAAGLPAEYKINDTTTKRILRDCARDVLPAEWAQRPKCGFPVPFHRWIHAEPWRSRVREVITSDEAAQFFDMGEMNRMFDAHMDGSQPNGRKIYLIYIFMLWYRRFFMS